MERANDQSPGSDVKLKVEVFKTLASAARSRLDNRVSFEWKICISLWTALGASAGFILASTKNLDPVMLVAVIVANVSILYVLGAWWFPWLRERNERDLRTGSTYWESAMEQAVGTELHQSLRIEGWQRFGEQDRPTSPGPKWYQHGNQLSQFAITSLFCALVVAISIASTIRWSREGSDRSAQQKILVEGSGTSRIVIDPITKTSQ